MNKKKKKCNSTFVFRLILINYVLILINYVRFNIYSILSYQKQWRMRTFFDIYSVFAYQQKMNNEYNFEHLQWNFLAGHQKIYQKFFFFIYFFIQSFPNELQFFRKTNGCLSKLNRKNFILVLLVASKNGENFFISSKYGFLWYW